MKSKLWVKIFVPMLIAAAVGGMWIAKNAIEKSVRNSALPQNNAALPENIKDADFNLRETKAIDFDALSAYGLPIIIDYGADSCIPCKQMAPVLEKANAEFFGKAFVKFINVWDYPDAANNVPVQVIPTQVLFNADGTPFVPSDELAKKIQFDMYLTVIPANTFLPFIKEA